MAASNRRGNPLDPGVDPTPPIDTGGLPAPSPPSGTGGGSWFDQQGTPGLIPSGPSGGAAGGGGIASGESAQAFIQRTLAGVPYGAESLRGLQDYFKQNGFTVNIDSSGGVRGRITNDRTGEFYDVTGPGEGVQWGTNPQAKEWGFTYHAADPGGGAGGGIGAGLENTPGYQFRLQQGLQALERSAASRGTLLTGGTLKGIQRYAQDVASQEYGNRVNQLTDLSRLGLGAAGTQGQLASAYGNTVTDLITGAGNAQAAGTVGSANAWQQALGGGGNMAMQYYLLSQLGKNST